ncbi:lipid A ABC transporter ATP-binding protein/permease MsbA [Utexia brackfieldae]|uniref:lipid A ABC transporter ATP-binding protein/permease MsbA n=1 Tax=Utexia brackfieldae TaxID=3074108 RepID=UPI00370DBBC3
MISPFKLGLIVAAICLVLNAVADTSLISLLKPLLDDGFGKADNKVMLMMPFVVIGLIFMRGIANYISTYSLSWVSGKIVMNMRMQIFSHLVKSPVAYYDQNSTGRLLSRITYDSEQVAASSSDALIVVVRESAYLIGLFGIMFYNSWQLSLVLLIMAPVVGLIIRWVSKHFRHLSKNIQNSMGNVTSTAEQMLKGHKEVLIFGAQDVENENFKRVSNRIRHQSMKMVSVSAMITPLIQIIASFALAAILFMASRAEFSNISPGAFTVVFSAMVALMKPLKELTSVNAQFQRGMAACQTLFHLLDSPLENDKGTLNIERAKGDIEFKQVTFTYPTRETPALTDVSFSIAAGKTIALVGRSGSGKSTIASLLTRFYDISQGEILLDGHNIQDYTLRSLRNQIGLVSQNVHLFHDTVANNITYGRPECYTRAQIEEAAKLAHAMDFIEKMEHGLDTIIGENGVLLSGGQRQRIAIARALLRDNPILILDEATSALDTESERVIQSALDELQKNRTSIVIAHRLSTIEKADEILVINDGRVLERGDHQTLLAKNGAYTQLHQMQFGDAK